MNSKQHLFITQQELTNITYGLDARAREIKKEADALVKRDGEGNMIYSHSMGGEKRLEALRGEMIIDAKATRALSDSLRERWSEAHKVAKAS